MLRVFIGYDPNETIAFHVAAHSIMRHASVPVSITPLMLDQLPLTRKRDPHQSTEFSYSRFLVPWLCNYEGMAVFMDCDVLVRADISTLDYDINAAVSVVKHDYIPKTEDKFLDHKQSLYQKKNWSSVMVFNNQKCTSLTARYVNTATGMELHQFKWADSIGEINPDWNHLVGEYEPNPNAKLVHFTLGTPCFKKYAHCEFADEWYAERDQLLAYNQIGEFSKELKTGT